MRCRCWLGAAAGSLLLNKRAPAFAWHCFNVSAVPVQLQVLAGDGSRQSTAKHASIAHCLNVCAVLKLQVLAGDGSWRLVAPVAGALTVNVGDMFQVGRREAVGLRLKAG